MKLILGSLIAFGCASLACAQNVESFELAGPTAVAVDGDGIPMFQAGRAFLLDLVGTNGEIFASSGTRVRISADGQSEVWLNCAELKPLKACATGTNSGTKARQDNAIRGKGIPICPGDPRCPRRRQK